MGVMGVMRRALLLSFLGVGGEVALGQWVGAPQAPELSVAGFALILEWETGGAAQYGRWPHPEWPGGASGVTVGVGYDCGYASTAVVASDWREVAGVERLAATRHQAPSDLPRLPPEELSKAQARIIAQYLKGDGG